VTRRNRILVASVLIAVAIGVALYLVWGGDSAPSERARWGAVSGVLLLLLLVTGAASRRRRRGRGKEGDRG
jgi:peptidoglycan/LPS O-acetylase OafA/YrhL